MASLAQLLDRLRVDLDDEAEPRLWSDAELVENINRAVDEACLRARLIRDSDSDFTRIRLRPGIARYSVHDSILEITRARIPGHRPIEGIVAEMLDRQCETWEDSKAERPTHYIANLDACWVRFHPVPQAVSTVNLTVSRKPVIPLSLDQPERSPEIAEIHHWNLLHWARHLAYDKHDAEAHDPQASATCAGMFAEFFGHRKSAEVQEILRRTRNLKVKAHFT